MTDLAALTLIGSARVGQCRLSPLAGAVQHLGLPDLRSDYHWFCASSNCTAALHGSKIAPVAARPFLFFFQDRL
jgi:hypothetical protein